MPNGNNRGEPSLGVPEGQETWNVESQANTEAPFNVDLVGQSFGFRNRPAFNGTVDTEGPQDTEPIIARNTYNGKP